MTHDEAVVQCERRNTEPSRPFRRWRPRQRRDGDWDVVVHISSEAARPRKDLRTTAQARQPTDPLHSGSSRSELPLEPRSGSATSP